MKVSYQPRIRFKCEEVGHTPVLVPALLNSVTASSKFSSSELRLRLITVCVNNFLSAALAGMAPACFITAFRQHRPVKKVCKIKIQMLSNLP